MGSGPSPLIRFGRYTALALGITYGYFHNQEVNKIEAVRLTIEAEKKKKHDEEHAKQHAALMAQAASAEGPILDPESDEFDGEIMMLHAEIMAEREKQKI